MHVVNHKTKFHAEGTLQKLEAVLVAEGGFLQTQRIDYLKTFSPIVKSTIIRVIITLSISHNWAIQ